MSTLFQPNVAGNKKKLQHVHDVFSLALGVAAGTFALESLYGFAFFVAGISAINIGFVAVCCHSQPKDFFENPIHDIFIDGVTGNVAGFVMMWCLTSALVK